MNRAERRAAGKVAESEYEPGWFARQMRPTCSECSGPVEWLGGLGAGIDALGLDQVNGVLEQMEPLGGCSECGPDVEIWRCQTCGEFGILMFGDEA